jgi:hypothetical protein
VLPVKETRVAKTVTVRANRSFGTIREGDVITISEDDARMQAFVASGYMTEVEGDEAKGAKKVEALEEADAQIVWDGTPGNRRGTTVQESNVDATHDDGARTAKVATKSAPAKESNGAG